MSLSSLTIRAISAAALAAIATTQASLAQCPGSWLTGGGTIGVAGMPNTVNSVSTALNGDVFAGGIFTTAGGVAASNVARWNGASWSALSTGTNSTVFSTLVLPSGDLIAAGQFGTAGGVAANRIARWNGSAWSTLGSGFNNTVYTLAAMPNGDIVAGGIFTTAGGVVATRVARWNGSAWSALGTGVDNQVNALAALPNGDLIVGGTFTTAGGVAASRVARWNGSAWSALTDGGGGNGVAGGVQSLGAMPDGSVIVGGSFSNAGSVFASSIARWSPIGGGTWSRMGDGVTPGVFSIKRLQDGTLIAGGDFVFDGQGVAVLNKIARWDGVAWQPYGAGTNSRVRSIAPSATNPGGFVIGGEFTLAGGASSIRVAQFSSSGVPTLLAQPVAVTEVCGSTAQFFAAAAATATYQWRRNGINLSDGITVGGSFVTGATTGSLKITSLTAADAGDYDCVVTASCAVTTALAHLTMIRCCPTDFDGDGVVNPADVGAFINAWFIALTSGC